MSSKQPFTCKKPSLLLSTKTFTSSSGNQPLNPELAQIALRRLALVDELEAKLAEVAGKAQEFKNGMSFWKARAAQIGSDASQR